MKFLVFLQHTTKNNFTSPSPIISSIRRKVYSKKVVIFICTCCQVWSLKGPLWWKLLLLQFSTKKFYVNQPGNLTTILYLQRDWEQNPLINWKLALLSNSLYNLLLLPNFLKICIYEWEVTELWLPLTARAQKKTVKRSTQISENIHIMLWEDNPKVIHPRYFNIPPILVRIPDYVQVFEPGFIFSFLLPDAMHQMLVFPTIHMLKT